MLIKNNNRDKAVDFLKLMALFHMVYNHIYITLFNHKESNAFLQFIDDIVPLCPAIFLFLSGYLMAVNKGYAKVKKRILFGFFLIATGSIFFITEHGFQYPDFIFSSGILYTLGINLIICTLIGICGKQRLTLITLLTAASVIIFVSLRLSEKNIFHLTTGYEPFLPTAIYGFTGFLYGELKNRNFLKNIVKEIIFISSLAVFLIYSLIYGFFKPLFPDIGRYTVDRIFDSRYFIQNIFYESRNVTLLNARIWNFDISCFIYSLAIIIMLLITADYIFNVKKIKFQNSELFNFIILPSKYLIHNYIIHLTIIALSTLIKPLNSLGLFLFIIYYFALIAFLYLINFFIFQPVGKKTKNHHGISPE